MMRHIDVDVTATGELVELARRQLDRWARAALELLPPDPARVDAHCHLGIDSDGSRIEPQELIEQLDGAGMRHALCAPLHQVDGYVLENARVRDWAAQSGGRLLALHRCDPLVHDPASDAEAGLAAGAAGLKWHPRAERFDMHCDMVAATAAVANEVGVPILIHAGRGMDHLGEEVVALARRHPRASFILAHAAVSDLGWIVDATRDVPNVVFDTSWWRPTDIAVLLASVEPGRVLHGSDPPYGSAGMGLVYSARIAAACGWSREELALLMGGTARSLVGLEPPVEQAAHRGEHAMPTQVPAMQRAGELLTAALHVVFAGGDPDETFDLAERALLVAPSDEHHDAALLLRGAIQVGRALVQRSIADRAHVVADAGGGVVTPHPMWRLGIELLCATLAHLATPALSIEGVDHVSWAEPAPFV